MSFCYFFAFLLIGFVFSEDLQQATVISQPREHALYLTIHVNEEEDPKEMAKVASKIQQMVEKVTPGNQENNPQHILAGVGFGYEFYKNIKSDIKDFSYKERKNKVARLPATGGDIFFHAKSDSRGKLFELAELIVKELDPEKLDDYEDVYGFVYREGRDLSGFVDGTANPQSEEHRKKVALDEETHSSYLITQKWVHNLAKIRSTSTSVLEESVGRKQEDSVILDPVPIHSHVASMTNSTKADASKPFEIVRQSQPYGTLKEAGLFFIAYAKSTENFDFMLEKSVGKEGEASDKIFLFTRATSGNYWFVPSKEELKKISSQ